MDDLLSCTECTSSCEADTYLNGSCPEGSPSNAVTCEGCQMGTFSADMNSATSCTDCTQVCPAGTFLQPACGNGTGLDASCQDCPVGRFKSATDGSELCDECGVCPQGAPRRNCGGASAGECSLNEAIVGAPTTGSGDTTVSVGLPDSPNVTVTIPGAIFPEGEEGTTVVIIVEDPDGHVSAPGDGSSGGGSAAGQPVSDIIIIDLVDANGTVLPVSNLSSPVVFETSIREQIGVCDELTCSWWDGAQWTDSGCYTVTRRSSNGDTEVSCGCDHLTDFAVLLREGGGSSCREQSKLYLVFVVLYAIIFLYAFVTLVRLLVAEPRPASWAIHGQHGLVAGSALARVFSSLNYLAVLGDIGKVPTALITGTTT